MTATAAIMDTSRLTPRSFLADQQEKARRVKEAQEAYQTIVRNAERTNEKVPPYDFLELIGKGAFGRVYKCRDQNTGDLVAVKILDTDDQDYTARWDAQDDTIRDFKKEVSILQQLKDSGARNVNIIHTAFDIHSQLWIVSDYCTGGSVRTLMHPNRGPRLSGLQESFIIPIARELAVALKDMHDIGIIHRDIKCSNVYITERGDIQLGDFGIVGVIENGVSKRTTVVGTPHWLPKEIARPMFDAESGDKTVPYSTEVDIWSYGCTIYEMAVGAPPNWTKRGSDIADSLEVAPPRLDGSFSPELCDFVAFCLTSDPKVRPSAEAVLRHPFIANTNKRYPTSNLIQLIERYKIWEHSGGSRVSLWIESLADPRTPGSHTGDVQDEDIEDWNFSTSDSFDQEFGKRISTMFTEPSATVSFHGPPSRDMTMAERVRREHLEKSVNRGEKSVMRIFDADAEYDLRAPAKEISSATASDLPLRNFTSNAPTRESMIEIDLDEADSHHNGTRVYVEHFADFAEDATVKGRRHETVDDDEAVGMNHERYDKRDTMAWTFPSQIAEPNRPTLMDKRDTMAWTFATAGPFHSTQPEEPEPNFTMQLPPAGQDGQLPLGFQPVITRTVTAPLSHTRKMSYALEHTPASASPARLSITSLIDLDVDFVDATKLTRPSTAGSTTGSTNGSVMTEMTSGNPFDLEDDPEQNQRDRDRFSYHKQWQSEGGHLRRDFGNSMQMHARGVSQSSGQSADCITKPVHLGSSNDSLASDVLDVAHTPQFTPDMMDSDTYGDHWDFHDRMVNTDNLAERIPAVGDYSRYGFDETTPTAHSDQLANYDLMQGRSNAFLAGPNPNAMLEDAATRLFEGEYRRLLEAVDGGLKNLTDSLLSSAPINTEHGDTGARIILEKDDTNVDNINEDESASQFEKDTRQRDLYVRSPQLPRSSSH